MSTDRMALNVRLPSSLHQGLVEVARREYRSLNNQILYFLTRAVLDEIDPQHDVWFSIMSHASNVLEPVRLGRTSHGGRPDADPASQTVEAWTA